MATPTLLRRSMLWILTIFSFLSTVALITFLGISSVQFASNDQRIRALAIASCVLELVSLLMLSILVWRESMVTEAVTTQEQLKIRKRRHLDILLSAVLACIGAATTIGTAAWMSAMMDTLQPILGLRPKSLMITNVVLLMASFVSEAAALALLFLESRDASLIVVLPPPEMSQSVRTWPEESSRVGIKKSTNHKLDPNPPMTSDSSSMSFRSSLTISTRPNSSKNPLVPSQRLSSESSHFDSWDTSTVPSQLRDTVHSRSAPQTRVPTMLPPIPGSRPASPAKALDGPFLPPSPHPSQLPNSPDTPAAFYSPPTSPPLVQQGLKTSPSLDSIPRAPFSQSAAPGSSDSLPLPRTYSQSSLADSVSHLPARNSPALTNQENIHPLFRTSSPTPPPGASAGTMLTAASIEEAVQGLERRRTTSKEGLRSRAASASGNYTPRDGLPNLTRMRADSREKGLSSPFSRHNSTWRRPSNIQENALDTSQDPEHHTTDPISAESSREASTDGQPSSEIKDDDASDASSALPDFIVAAAQRRSFEGFERRKSTRDSARPAPAS